MTECEESLEEKFHSESVRTEILIRLEKTIKSGISDKLKGWPTITEKAERLSEWIFYFKQNVYRLIRENYFLSRI